LQNECRVGTGYRRGDGGSHCAFRWPAWAASVSSLASALASLSSSR
jgi:hypothetical protein